MTPIQIAQQILFGKWQHAPAALQACQRGDWATFARSTAPPKPLLVGRLEHGRALALAEPSLKGPETSRLRIVPLWACSAAEEPERQWVAAHGVAPAGEPLIVRELGPFIAVDDASPRLDALAGCTVRHWTASIVASGDLYSPGLPRIQHVGAFAVVSMDMYEVVDIALEEGDALPRPTREVPIFATWLEPRVQVTPELESQIRALSITPTDEPESGR